MGPRFEAQVRIASCMAGSCVYRVCFACFPCWEQGNPQTRGGVRSGVWASGGPHEANVHRRKACVRAWLRAAQCCMSGV